MRVRDWFKLRCDDAMYGSVVLLAGSRGGVFLKVDDQFHATVLMALRKGDARVIQLNRAEFGDGYEGDGYVVVRDPSTEVVKEVLKKIIETVRVHYA